jgi:hypothetical protein
MNIGVIVGTTHTINVHYPAAQAQVVPSQLDPARYKIPARGRIGTLGFSSLDFMDNDQVRAFNGVRAVAFLSTSRNGVVYWTDVLYDWDCVISTTKPEGDPPATLTAEDRSFRYGFGFPGGGIASESLGGYATVTPFAGGETLVALAYLDPVADGFILPTNQVTGAFGYLAAPPGMTTTLISGSTYQTTGGILYWGSGPAGNASGITPTT